MLAENCTVTLPWIRHFQRKTEAINISDSEGLTEMHCRHTGFI